MDIVIVGGGIGGLTLALALHAAGRAQRIRVFEAAPEIRPLGVGINIGPHAMKELSALGLEDALAATSCQPQDYAFFTRHGQLVYREPFGTAAGHQWPHFSLLRADLQRVLLDAVRERIGPDKLHHRASLRRRRAERRAASPRASPLRDGTALPPQRRRRADRLRRHPFGGARAVLSRRRPVRLSRLQPVARHDAAEAVPDRRQHRPHRRAAFDHASSIRCATTSTRTATSSSTGSARSSATVAVPVDWNKPGRLEDFFPTYQDWTFDWMDVPALIRGADADPVLSDGRPRSAAALELRARDAAGRRRASDVSAGRQRRRAGDPRRRNPGAAAQERARSGRGVEGL